MQRLIRNIIGVVIIAMSLISCEENLDVDSTPAIQAVRNGSFFGAQQMIAVRNADGTLSIQGINPLETLNITLSSDALGTYALGPGGDSEAVYVFNNTNPFSTSRGFGRGEVVLSRSLVGNTISGSFDFVSYLPGQVDSLYMRRGIIYQVPFGDPIGVVGPGAFAASFNAMVNGVGLNPDALVPLVTSGTLSINAANTARDIIVLTFPVDIAVGNYSIATTGSYRASYADGGSAFSAAVSGTLEITAVDAAAATVEGTFSFRTGPPGNYEVTGGTFSIEY
jgi:hypothetical protein